MAARSEIAVEIHSRNDRDLAPASGVLQLVEWNSQERVKNAAKTFGMFIAFTFFAVLAPVLHYFLVPALFITTFVMTMERYSQIKTFEGGKGICPKCKNEIMIQKSRYKDRLTDTCSHCHDDLEILIKN